MRISSTSISGSNAAFDAEDADSKTVDSSCVVCESASCMCRVRRRLDSSDWRRDDDGRGDEVRAGLKAGRNVDSVEVFKCPRRRP